MLGGGGVLLSSLHRLGGGLTHPTLAKTLAKSLSSITPWHNRVLAKTRRLRRVHGPAPASRRSSPTQQTVGASTSERIIFVSVAPPATLSTFRPLHLLSFGSVLPLPRVHSWRGLEPQRVAHASRVTV